MWQHKLTYRFFITLAGLALLLAMLTACTSSQPVDTSRLTKFTHRAGVFSLQVPEAWKVAQDEVETESIAAFSDPSHRAELIAYAGLREYRLNETEGQQAVAELIRSLLNAPGDLQITTQSRRPDGAFSATFSFTRNNEKRSGTALFRDNQLALAGVILSGPEAGWADFQEAMQPAVDSLAIEPVFVQGTYFAPLDGNFYALASPAGWPPQAGMNSHKVRSPNGRLTILAASQTYNLPLNDSSLVEAGRRLLMPVMGESTVLTAEKLPDGRLKAIFDHGENRQSIGYLEQKDNAAIALFFSLPADRLQDYQSFTDFVYSTFITGKS